MPDADEKFPILGESYGRKTITKHLGGNHRTYLPMLNGRVLYGCFKPDIDGDAPRIVLVGDTEKIIDAADQFYAQSKRAEPYIPIFIMRDRKKWEYVGHYKAVDLKTVKRDLPTVKKYNPRNLDHVTGVLFLEPRPTIESNPPEHQER